VFGKRHLPAIKAAWQDKRKRGVAALLVIAAAAFYVFRPTVDKDAHHFVDALIGRHWSDLYSFESDAERSGSGWDEATFAKFCGILSQRGWPTRLRPQIDEIFPIVNKLKPGQIGIDDSWNRAGTREYVVTLFQGATSVQDFSIQFRHGRDGEWHPDVIATLLHVAKGDRVRGARVQSDLLQAMQAVGSSQLTLYPEGDQTDDQRLRDYLAGTTRTWLRPGSDPLH
jgi:hypothetical protein